MKDRNILSFKYIIWVLILFSVAFLFSCSSTDVSKENETDNIEIEFPRIAISTGDNDGESLTKEDGYVDCTIVFTDTDGSEITDENGKIKVRGNSTSFGAKKPYNIKFAEKYDLFGFDKSKKWALLADCFDVSLMRNKIFLDLAKDMDMDTYLDSKYVELYLDDTYLGCYLLTETADVGKGRVDINVNDGDFIFEFEADRYEEGKNYIISKYHDWRFVIEEPETDDPEIINNIQSTIDLYDSVIFTDNYEEIKKYLDVDSFAKLYLLNEYAKTVDFLFSSVKFYSKNGKLYAGPAWDFDLTTGNYSIWGYSSAWVGEGDTEKRELLNSHEDFWCEGNPVFRTLLLNDEFRKLVGSYFDEYYELFANVYGDGGVIDQLLAENLDLYTKNYTEREKGGAGWKVDEQYNFMEYDRFPTYEDNIEYLRSWLQKRLAWLKENNDWS